MPQFEVVWFGSQIFWFSISFGAFSIFCSKVVVPFIINQQLARQELINDIIDSANSIIEESEAIKNKIDSKVSLAKAEAAVIIKNARKKAVDDSNSSNNQILDQIDKYYDKKMSEIENFISTRKNLLIKHLPNLSSNIAESAGFDHFVINSDGVNKMKKDFKSL